MKRVLGLPLWAALLLIVSALAVVAVLVWRVCDCGPGRRAATIPEHSLGAGAASQPLADYVGAAACASCHQEAYDAWRTSQHREAMQTASRDSVKGRFDGAEFRYDEIVSKFFQRDGRYFVRTDGPDGTLADFEITYTFGVYPLQQYLIELPKGRMQALSIAWDTRPRLDGGQRWFHLYPNERIKHGDALHWTGRQQNWNFMCASCHSTNLRKNYEPASDTFKTTWSEMNVSCEACHGPGSRHVTWAQRSSPDSRTGDNGLTAQLSERRGTSWTTDPATMKPVRSSPRTTAREIETCAQCHSRRAPIAEGYRPGVPFLDFYEPAALEPGLYFADGQQRDEVYTYASFQQSRMAHAGVTCSDCHEPHSAKLRATGNALCLQCHVAARYDAPSHHHHKAASAGATCVECHMPPRTYMQIDARRDHSLRVPRPDQTTAMGVPNACGLCHANRSAAWATEALRGWLGRDPVGFQTFTDAFHAADEQRPDAMSLLNLATSEAPAIVRASAFDRLAQTDAPASSVAVGLSDADPLVRQRALRALETAPPLERAPLAMRLLSDPIRSVRIAAARLMAPSTVQLTGADRANFDQAAAEIAAEARGNADRPESRVSFGVFLADQGRTREAEDEYRDAIRLGPDFTPGYINLADLLRTAPDEAAAERVLRDGLARNPKSADLHFALGLSLTRSRRPADALKELKRAGDLAPEIARFPYAYALALEGAGQRAAAIGVLASALVRHPNDRDILFGIATLERDAGRIDDARRHAAHLAAIYPGYREGRMLVESLRDRRD